MERYLYRTYGILSYSGISHCQPILWKAGLIYQLCFKQIPLIKIPRFVGIVDKSATYQLLVFCDASIKAYAASVYLRIKDEAGVKTHLMFSKMRLVPMNKGERRKELTIPRLELLAVLIGIRAANFVTKDLRLKITDRILWTDSQSVLYWLKTKKPLSVFVENRIREIKLEEDVTFRYVPTLHNPSDYATRGLSVQEIMCSSLWWHGPSWRPGHLYQEAYPINIRRT